MRRAGRSLALVLMLGAAGVSGAQGEGTPSGSNAVPASSYVTVGHYYYGQGNLAQAVIAYEAALRANPANSDALLGLGRTQARQGQTAAAVSTLQWLIQLDPNNISAYIALSQVHSGAFQQAGRSREQLQAALDTLKAAEGVLPNLAPERRRTESSKIWNERGYILRFEGDLAGAARAFQEAARLNPAEGVILFNLAETQYAGGDLAGAAATMERAVRVQPADAPNRAYLARLLAEGGNFAAARPQAAMAVRLAPQNAYVAGQYGVVSYLAHEVGTAREQLSRAVTLSGGSYPDFSYYLGRLNLDADNLPAARRNFEDTVQKGENAEAAFFWGLSLERRSAGVAPQPGPAASAYRRALELRPDFPEAREGLARLGQQP